MRWWPIVLCALSVLLDGYDAQMFAMAIPLMAKEFGVAPTAFAPAASASLAGMAIGALFLSPLADRFGRRPLLIVSLAPVRRADAARDVLERAVRDDVVAAASGLRSRSDRPGHDRHLRGARARG